jgi:polysaccharide biosynthesis protein PslG
MMLASLLYLGLSTQSGGVVYPLQPIKSGFGVNVHFNSFGSDSVPNRLVPGEKEYLRAAKFNYIRMDLIWADTERQKGRYDFAKYVKFCEVLQKEKLTPILILDYGNGMYPDPDSSNLNNTPSNDDQIEAYAKWCAAAVKALSRFDIVYEIYNEPNLKRFWSPKPDAKSYQKLLLKAAGRMKEVFPKCKIISGGIAGFDFKYFNEFLNTEVLSLIDGVAVHPYVSELPELTFQKYNKLNRLVTNLSPLSKKGIPIINSEAGFSTHTLGKTEDQQATNIIRQFLVSAVSNVPVSICYDWKDDGDDDRENEHRFGLIRNDSVITRASLKPSYLACADFLSKLNSQSKFSLIDISKGSWTVEATSGEKHYQFNWEETSNLLPSVILKGVKKTALQQNKVDPFFVESLIAPLFIGNKSFVWVMQNEADYDASTLRNFTKSGSRSEDKYYSTLTKTGDLSFHLNKTLLKYQKMDLNSSDWISKPFLNNSRYTAWESSMAYSNGTCGFSFDFVFEPGYRYDALKPTKKMIIPASAKSLNLWYKPDGTNNRLCSRFQDQTGRTFQVVIGSMSDEADYSGYRIVSIPFDGSGIQISWGGVEGAPPTGRLHWDSLVIVDSGDHTTVSSGTVCLGGAAYSFN